jgi:hypothetical protein
MTMNDQKKPLSQLLRQTEVYEVEGGSRPDDAWREALLSRYEQPEVAPLRQADDRRRSPLEWHHVIKLSPAGLGFFAAGWLVGKGPQASAVLASVPPVAWMVCAIALSAGFLGWRGLLTGRR